MNRDNLAKLFATFGLFALVISANTWIAGQGGKAILSVSLLSEERAAAVLYGLILVGGLLGLTATCGLLHALRYGSLWHDRIPTIWLTSVNTARWEGQIYQVAIVLLLVGVPSASLFKFGDTLFKSSLCIYDIGQPRKFAKSWPHNFKGAAGKQIRLVGDGTPKDPPQMPCSYGVEVFPPMEFIAIFSLDILALGMVIAFLWALFRDLCTERPSNPLKATMLS